jgi:hypothetical protein
MQYQQREHAFAMEADDDVVVVDRFGAKMFTLNTVGGLLWNHLDQPRTTDELVDVLRQRWSDVDDDRFQTDVEAFVESAIDAGIIVPVAG